jgi:hypothetical protein
LSDFFIIIITLFIYEGNLLSQSSILKVTQHLSGSKRISAGVGMRDNSFRQSVIGKSCTTNSSAEPSKLAIFATFVQGIFVRRHHFLKRLIPS